MTCEFVEIHKAVLALLSFFPPSLLYKACPVSVKSNSHLQ